MSKILYVNHHNDLYEVALNGYVITRISMYRNGDNVRQEFEFDDLPKELQEKIIEKVSQHVTHHHA